MKTRTPAPEAIQTALERMEAGRTFSRASGQMKLLRYVVEKAAAGQAGEIKEYGIALDVFGRETYDPKIDSLVRVAAANLRQRLAAYYEAEGREDPVRIEIPKGSYVPVVSEAHAPETPTVAIEERRGWRAWIVAASACLIVAVFAAAAVWWRREPARTQPPATPSIAVLPFADMSPAQDHGAFCDGLTEELINQLSQLERLRVASRTSVFEYKNRDRDVRRIGQDLEVLAVLEGSVRREGRRLRVTAQLVNTQDGFHLWTKTYDRDVGEMFGNQNEIAAAIAKTFRAALITTGRALVRRNTNSADAWHHYLRAVELTEDAENGKAVEFYKAAIAVDPGYALAWAGLSHTLAIMADWGEARPLDVLPQAAEAAGKALELDANLAEAQQVNGWIKVLNEQDWRGAERAFRRAIELDSSHVEARYDYARLVLNLTGRFTEAMEQLERAITLSPESNPLHNELAYSYLQTRQYDRAGAHLERSRELTGRAPAVMVFEGIAAIGKGDEHMALAYFEKAATHRRSAWVLGYMGHTLARLGRQGEVDKILAELEHSQKVQPVPDYSLAVIHTASGRTDQALQHLERAVAERSPFALSMKVDYRLDDLRAHARFRELLRRLRLD